MTKPTESSAEFVEMICDEMKDFAGCPPTMQVHVKPDGQWLARIDEFRKY